MHSAIKMLAMGDPAWSVPADISLASRCSLHAPVEEGDDLLRVDDRVVAAVGPGQLRLLVRADRADHGRAQRLEPLAGDQADAAGRGVEEDRVARLHPV